MGWSKPQPKASKQDDGTVDFYIWWEEDLDMIILYEPEIRAMLKLLLDFKKRYQEDNNE